MKNKKNRYVGFLLLLGILSSGCEDSTGTGNPTGSIATTQDAQNAADATYLVAIQAINDSLAASLKIANLQLNEAALTFKNTIDATPTGSCSEQGLPSLASNPDTMTLNGTSFSCQSVSGSGSCIVSHQKIEGSTSTTGQAIINCSNLIVPVETDSSTCENVNLDGEIGIDYTVSYSGTDTTYDIDFSSDNLREEILNCDLGLNHSLNFTVDINANGTASGSGCLNECGTAFSISGSESL